MSQCLCFCTAPITSHFFAKIQWTTCHLITHCLSEMVWVKDLALKALLINMVLQLALLLSSSLMPSLCWPPCWDHSAHGYGLGSLSVCVLCLEFGSVGTATEIQDSCFWSSWATMSPSTSFDRQSPELEEPASSPRAVQRAPGEVWANIFSDDGLPLRYHCQSSCTCKRSAPKKGKDFCREIQKCGYCWRLLHLLNCSSSTVLLFLLSTPALFVMKVTTDVLSRDGKDIAFGDYSATWRFHRKIVHGALCMFGEGSASIEKISKSACIVSYMYWKSVTTLYGGAPTGFRAPGWGISLWWFGEELGKDYI